MSRVPAIALVVALAAALGLARLAIAEPVSTAAWAPWSTPAMSEPVTQAGEVPGAVPLSLEIHNAGTTAERLLGGTTPLAERVEAHQTRIEDGRRAMHALPDGIVIPPGATVILEPGAAHLMLDGLRQPLVQGATFPLTLRFAHAGEVPVQARVRRKLDAAGVTPIPPVVAGELTISLVSAPPAPGPVGTPQARSSHKASS